MRYLLTLISLLLFLSGFAQSKKSKRLPDKVILLNSEVETGKIIKSDSNYITLRKGDFSEKKILWLGIDTVMGLSYSTLFFSPSVGLSGINYFSTFRYDKVYSGGMNLQLKLGKMYRRRWAWYVQLTEMPVKPYNIFKTGIGFNYYLLKGYTEKFCLYLGGKMEMNSVKTNAAPFFNRAVHIGAEYQTKYNNRFFIELSRQKTFLNVYNGTGITFNLGLRFSREYKNRYIKLNTQHRL